MRYLGFFRASLLSALVSAASLGLAVERNPLIQPRVSELVDRAQFAATMGRYQEAMACTEAVMLKPVVALSVDFGGLDEAARLKAERALHRATDEWETTFGGDTKFVFVGSGPADIRISYDSDVTHLGREVAGTATWSRQVYDWGTSGFTSYVSADIQLRTVLPGGGAMSEDALVQTSLHEIGHVFGLWDSAVQGEVMGPLNVDRPVTSLSFRERDAILEVRSVAYSIWQTCASSNQTLRGLSASR